MRHAISSLAVLAATQAPAAIGIPKASRSDLQQLSGAVIAMQERVNAFLEDTGGGVEENDSRVRIYLLEFSQKLERLEDNLNSADANWDEDYVYAQWIKRACLDTRRLFVINSQARRSAGESDVGQILPHNLVFDDSRTDVLDVRDTVYCETIEGLIDNHHKYSSSKWKSQYNAGGQKVPASMELQGSGGTYQTSSFTGVFKNVIYFEDHISARWDANGQSGWVEFPLKGDAFNGFWGQGDLGTALGGEWWGNKGKG